MKQVTVLYFERIMYIKTNVFILSMQSFLCCIVASQPNVRKEAARFSRVMNIQFDEKTDRQALQR